MKCKWILVLLLVCASVAQSGVDPNEPEQREGGTLWIFGEPTGSSDSEVGMWLGYIKKGNEFGLATKWNMFSEGDTPDDTKSQFSIGLYGLHHFPDVVPLLEDKIWPAEWLPDGMSARPGVGIQLVFDTDGKGYALSPVGTLLFYDIICLQYQYAFQLGNTAENGKKYGLSLYVPF